MSNLTIITVAANDGKSRLAEFMVRSVLKFTKPRPKLIICNNGDCHNFITKYADKAWARVVNSSNIQEDSSSTHGFGLNKIFPLVQTEFTAIIEPDCVVLNNDWDKFDTTKYDMRAPLKGYGSDNKKYYHPCFMVFKTESLRGIDFMSGTKGDERGIIREASNYSDVAWRVANFIDSDRVEELFVRRCADGATRYFRHIALEYKTCEFWLNDTPVAAHFYRGSDPSRRATVGNIAYGAQRAVWKSIVDEILNDKTPDEIFEKHKEETIKEIRRRINKLETQLHDLIKE